jgi:molecular chaperone DnaJ
MKDPFAILGVPPNAEDKEIRLAYQKLVRAYHPDRSKGDPEKTARFHDVSWAWRTIGRAAAREKYLQERGDKYEQEVPFAKYYGDREGNLPPRGANIEVDLQITFYESYRGTTLPLPLLHEQVCDVCGGSGAKPGTVPNPCRACKGQGFHAVGRVRRTCETCQGKGMLIEDPCEYCHDGMRNVEVVHQVEVPAGTLDGDSVTLKAKGAPGWAEPGDLIVRIQVQPSQIFHPGPERGDVIVDVPVHYTEAVLGTSLLVPTPDPDRNVIKVDLPPAAQSQQRLRVRNLGMPRPDGTRGHLYVRANVHVPKEIDPNMRKIIGQMRAFEDPALREEIIRGAQDEL